MSSATTVENVDNGWERTVVIPEGTPEKYKSLYDTPYAPWDWDLNAMMDAALDELTSVYREQKKTNNESVSSWRVRHLQNAHHVETT